MAIDSQHITNTEANGAIVEWFEKLGRCCASVDHQSARAIFAEDVLSFGTRADIVSGLELLHLNQWEGIWPNIQDFKINMETIHSGGDQHNAWGVATWTSTGFHDDGSSFERPGRAAVFAKRESDVPTRDFD